jgi:hypothetical protein
VSGSNPGSHVASGDRAVSEQHATASRSCAGRHLLLWLEATNEVRADTFRQCYERGGHEALLGTLTDWKRIR